MTYAPVRALVAEGVGSLLLTAAVVGSGVMGQRLAAGNDAIALLANTGATMAALAVLIGLFSPVSGAHFNPAVTLAMAARTAIPWRRAGAYVLVQFVGCYAGTLLAHTMFALPLWQSSSHARAGTSQWLAEVVATGGLICVVLGHRRKRDAPWMVAAWIGAAYWFTASTSFANPAITLARSFSDTFAGIRPADAPAFIVAQLVGCALALAFARVVFGQGAARSIQSPLREPLSRPRVVS
jgi:glycerol uptake facilitator-like aquaporin